MQGLVNSGKENSRIISRRAKNDSKKLTISPLKEKDFNALGITPATAAPTEAVCDPANAKEADRITQLEQEKSALERLCEEAEARAAAAGVEKEAIENDRRDLAIQNARLAAQVHLTNLQHQVAEKEMQDKIKALEKALKESEEARQREQEESSRQLESEKKVHSILQKSYEQVSKELESKTNKIERLQELAKVSKEIATNLQTEKQTLQDQLSIERDTTRRLHTLAESSTEECARMETQLEEQTQVIEKLNRDQENNRKQLFLSSALAIKLHKLYYDRFSCNLSIHELWEKVQMENIAPERWSAWIEEQMEQSTPQFQKRKNPLSPGRNIQIRGE
eukprot:TRINITY_DN13306_c0_g1_i1.p1 TRINITY_DN13306_c0_g1~~TRINITY_DN13306_c0_g1_i1.p1  ORF type:complete len:336 (+),score=115.93 TRINITY_DN13306_c0_g1_i1:47-1054(+)